MERLIRNPEQDPEEEVYYEVWWLGINGGSFYNHRAAYLRDNHPRSAYYEWVKDIKNKKLSPLTRSAAEITMKDLEICQPYPNTITL